MFRINDPKKHKVLYKWELYDVIINFQCVQDLVFLRIINFKHSEFRAVKLLQFEFVRVQFFFIHTVKIEYIYLEIIFLVYKQKDACIT